MHPTRPKPKLKNEKSLPLETTVQCRPSVDSGEGPKSLPFPEGKHRVRPQFDRSLMDDLLSLRFLLSSSDVHVPPDLLHNPVHLLGREFGIHG